MKDSRIVPVLLSTILLTACTTAHSPNDTASRALNEMKAVPRPVPPKPDPRDLRIAELERQKADLEGELARLRSSSAAELDQSKARVSELDNQLSQRDRELAGLRSAVGDKDRLAGQLSDADRQLSAKDQELSALRQGAGDKDRLAGELAALQGSLALKDQELAGLKSDAGDRDRLSSELSQAKQRIAELERQLNGKDLELGLLKNAAGDRDKLVADLAAAKQRASDLESDIARRDHEMAGLKGALDQQKTSLAEAKDDLSKLLQAEVAKGNVTMKQLGDQLTLGLATTLLFDSGEATLKPGGSDVLNRIGSVLKNYPDRSIHVAGHTDNVPIKGRLAKKFPTNAELSQARAESARQALTEGGMSGDKVVAKGHADSRPIASNTTAEGRQKNRRVEIVVGQ